MMKGWMALLNGFGIAENPQLFGKMLRKAPFMLYINPPKIDDEDTSNLIENETAIPSTSFIACGALKVLQLLKSQNFPDLDKIVRSQPTILLTDPLEISARINFLSDMFLENTSQSLILSPECVLPLPSSIKSNTFGIRTISMESNPNLTDAEIFGNRDNVPKMILSSIGFQSVGIYTNMKSYSKNGSNKDRRNGIIADREVIPTSNVEFMSSESSAEKSPVITETESSRRIAIAQRILSANNKNKLNKNDGKERGRGIISHDINRCKEESLNLLISNQHDSQIPNGGIFTKIADLNTKSQEHLQHIETANHMLGTLMLSYPAILSIEHRRMRDAGNALRSSGLRRGEVILLARRHPPVLGRDPILLVNLISFLRFTCGLHKVDLLPFLYRYPAVLGAEVRDIEPKVEYLFQTLGGSQEMLRRFPSFLSFDLEAHTRPRAEFLRALKIDPLINGLAFLVNAPAKEIAYTAGVRVELFNQFQTAYLDMCKRKNLIEKVKTKNSFPVNSKEYNQKAHQISSWIDQHSKPEESLLDEFDLSF